MKRFTMLFVAMFLATTTLCSAQELDDSNETRVNSLSTTAQSDDVPWPIEPKNEYAECLLEYYNLNCKLWSIDEEYVAALAEVLNQSTETINSELTTIYEDADNMWRKFVWLTNENRIEEAVAFYVENRIMIDCAISDSEMRLFFHDEVIGDMASEVMPEMELYAFMTDVLEFDQAMVNVLYMSNGSDDTLYNLMYIHDTLDTLYSKQGRYDDMFALLESTEGLLGGLDRAYKLFMSAQIYYLMGDVDTAMDMLLEAKDILTQRIEDGIDVEESGLALSMVIDAYEACLTL